MSEEEPAPEAPSEESAAEAPPEVPAEDPPAEAPPEDPPAEAPPEDPPAEAPPEDPPTELPPEDPPTEATPEEPPVEAPPEDPPAEPLPEDPLAEAPSEDPSAEAPPEEPPAEPSPDEPPKESPSEVAAEETQLGSPLPDTGDEEGLPPPAPMTQGVSEAGLNKNPSLMSTTSVMEGKSHDPVAGEEQRRHELEIMRSLIYEDKGPRGFQLPSEYGPHGTAGPELGPQRMMRVPRNIAQQILDVIGGREAFPCNECDACAGTDCDEDGVMSFVGDLVLGLVEIVTEKLFQRKDGVSQGTNMDCAQQSVTNMVQKSLADMAGALSQKTSQMSQKALPEVMEVLSQKASQFSQRSMPEALEVLNSMGVEAASKAASKVISKTVSNVAASVEEAEPPAE